mgnify:CR=1 FL=1
MREPLIETFTIQATFDDFKNWLTSDAMAREQGKFIPFQVMNYDGVHTWYYSTQKGYLIFEVRVISAESLSITVTLQTLLVPVGDGTERYMLDETTGIVEHYRVIERAIKEKFRQTATIPTLSAAAPPWDRLAHKAEWTPEDWVYFFDHLIPNIPEGYPVTIMPNWPAMAALTVKFCDNPKKYKTIRERYHAVYTKQD